jgi:hypothetical protein
MITEDDIKRFVASLDNPGLLLLLDRMTKERLEKVGVSKSKGSPVGEYAEFLVATALEGIRMPNAKEGHDITLQDGTRIEVKGRIFEGRRVPLSDIKHSTIENKTFDLLVYVVFNEDMTVKYALKIPFVEFQRVANYCEPKNGVPKWRFHAHPRLLEDSRIANMTEALRLVETKMANHLMEPTG